LNVGITPVTLPNVMVQIYGTAYNAALQLNNQNMASTGSVDYIGTADVGTNSNNYIDLGINNSTYTDSSYSSMGALDGYLYVNGSSSTSTDGNLIIGTASSGGNVIIIAGGTTSANIICRLNKSYIDVLRDLRVTGNVIISNTATCGTVTYGKQVLSPNYITVTTSALAVQLSNISSMNTLLTAPSTATVTITMPQNPVNGQLCGFVNASSNATTYASAAANPTLIPTFAGATAIGKSFRYCYNSGLTSWIAAA